MTFGRPLAGGTIDPLFAMFFMLATVLNFVPVLLAEPTRIEVILVGAPNPRLAERDCCRKHNRRAVELPMDLEKLCPQRESASEVRFHRKAG